MIKRAQCEGGGPQSDRGAAAVEFALVLPLLLLLVLGIIDFGRLYFTQITLTDAAREGVRVLALGTADPTVTTQTAASGVVGTVLVTPTPCTNGDVEVQAQVAFHFLTPGLETLLGGNLVTGKGVMRCGG